MKRIGIDCRLWNETGVGRYIRNLVEQVQKLDTLHQYVLFVRTQDIQQVNFTIRSSSMSLVAADIPWHSLQEQFEYPKILENENLDLLHFPYFSVPMWYKRKFVVTIHDLILHHFPTGKSSTHNIVLYNLKLQGYKYIISQATKQAQKIITVSDATKREIVEHLHVSEDKIITIREGVFDDSRFNVQSSKSQFKSQNYFLYVGNAYPHKNLETLLEAFSTICGLVSTIKLIFVGKEDYFYSRLEKKVKELGLGNAVIFKHDVNDEELVILYQNALALVMPSFMEGFGLPGLEAMSQGALIIASDIPVFHEIYQEVPLYFDAKSSSALAECMVNVYKGKILNTASKIAYGKKLAKKFSWGNMAKATIAVYEGCIGV